MIKESNLTKFYSQIAEKLDEMIPCDWNKIVLYGEEDDEIRQIQRESFIFYKKNESDIAKQIEKEMMLIS